MKQFIHAGIAALALNATAAVAMSNSDLSPYPREQTAQISQLIDTVFSNEDGFTASDRITIKKIADCESGGKTKTGGPNGLILHIQSNGSITTNRSSGATGAFQILSRAHSKHFWARQKYNEERVLENLRYARALMRERIKREGHHKRFADWTASKPCWTKPAPHDYTVSE